MAATSKLAATLKSTKTAKGTKLTFSSAKLYFDKSKTVVGTAKRASSVHSLALNKLDSGTHTLKVVISYKKPETKTVKKHGKKVKVKKTVTVTKTVSANFSVC